MKSCSGKFFGARLVSIVSPTFLLPSAALFESPDDCPLSFDEETPVFWLSSLFPLWAASCRLSVFCLVPPNSGWAPASECFSFDRVILFPTPAWSTFSFLGSLFLIMSFTPTLRWFVVDLLLFWYPKLSLSVVDWLIWARDLLLFTFFSSSKSWVSETFSGSSLSVVFRFVLSLHGSRLRLLGSKSNPKTSWLLRFTASGSTLPFNFLEDFPFRGSSGSLGVAHDGSFLFVTVVVGLPWSFFPFWSFLSGFLLITVGSQGVKLMYAKPMQARCSRVPKGCRQFTLILLHLKKLSTCPSISGGQSNLFIACLIDQRTCWELSL